MIVCVDFGGTRIKIGLMDDNSLAGYSSVNIGTHSKIHSLLANVKTEVQNLLQNYNVKMEECIGLGIAFPGLVNPVQKRVLSTNEKYDDAVEFDFENWSKQEFDLPIILENDANAALLGEWQLGCGKDFKDIVLMILGTGVGTAALMDGKLVRGKHFQAGCLGGHFIVAVNGRKCTCGNYGCVEAESGTWALPEIIKQDRGYPNSILAKEEILDFRSIMKWKNRDRLAGQIYIKYIQYWSAGIVNLVHAYDPELIILSGGIMHSGDEIMDLIKENVSKWAWTNWGDPVFRIAENPDISPLLGLAYLVNKEFGHDKN